MVKRLFITRFGFICINSEDSNLDNLRTKKRKKEPNQREESSHIPRKASDGRAEEGPPLAARSIALRPRGRSRLAGLGAAAAPSMNPHDEGESGSTTVDGGGT